MSAILTFTHTRQPRVMSRAEALAARAAGKSARELIADGLLPPIAGAAEDDDDSDDDGGDDDDSDDDTDDDDDHEDDAKAKSKTGRGKSKDAADDDDDDDDDDVSKAKRTAAEAQARAKKAEQRARVAERKLERQKRDEQEEQGEFKGLYEQEKSRADGLEKKLRNGAMERAIVAVATEAKAKKPERIIRLVDLSVDDVVDDEGEVDQRAVERAVRDLKKSDRYLFKGDDPQTGELNGSGAGRRRRRPNVDEDIRGAERIRSAYESSST